MICTHVPLTDITFNLHVGFHRFKRRGKKKQKRGVHLKIHCQTLEKLNTQRAHM